jgi:hypothetical protein
MRDSFRFRVGSKGKLRIVLSKKPTTQSQSISPQVTQSDQNTVFATRAEDDYLIPPQKRAKAIAFYDLGTRLRSVLTTDLVPPLALRFRPYPVHDLQSPGEDKTGEYVEIPLEVRGTYLGDVGDGSFGQFSVSTAEWTKLQDMLLGSLRILREGETEPTDDTDPTGFSQANGSDRQTPHCELFPLVNGFVKVGSKFLAGSGSPNYRVKSDRSGLEPGPSTTSDFEFVDEDDTIAEERWSPENLGQIGVPFKIPDDLVKTLSGHLTQFMEPFDESFNHGINGSPFRRISDGKLQVFVGNISTAVYTSFYPVTTDPEFCKVTATPSYDVDPVTYSFTGKDNRVYIRPLMSGVSITSGLTKLATWVARDTPFYAHGLFPCAAQRSAYSGGFSLPTFGAARHQPLDPISTAEGPLQRVLPAQSLVAIIAQGTKRFYVWSKEDWLAFSNPNVDTLGECTE